jgi:hypothetical protein
VVNLLSLVIVDILVDIVLNGAIELARVRDVSTSVIVFERAGNCRPRDRC